MGLTTWASAPNGKIVKSDVSIAKNYLSKQEIRSLERIVSAYLDLAEDRAERHIPMTMEDWSKRLDLFLMADDRKILQDVGKITAEIAKSKAETEFEKYRVIQDRMQKLNDLQDYAYYFQFTLTGYGKDIEPNLPDKRKDLIPTFQKLSEKIGKEKVIWRYDPILVVSDETSNSEKRADKQTAENCLELWDIMFERQLGSVREISRKLMER